MDTNPKWIMISHGVVGVNTLPIGLGPLPSKNRQRAPVGIVPGRSLDRASPSSPEFQMSVYNASAGNTHCSAALFLCIAPPTNLSRSAGKQGLLSAAFMNQMATATTQLLQKCRSVQGNQPQKI